MFRRFWVNPHINFSLRLSSGLLLFLSMAWSLDMLHHGVISCLIMPAVLIGGIDIPTRDWLRRGTLAVIGFSGIAGASAYLALQQPLLLTPWFAVIGFLLTSCSAFGNLAARWAMGTLTMAVIGMASANTFSVMQLSLGYAIATTWMLLYSALWYRISGNMPLRLALVATYRHLAKLLTERPEQLLDHKLPVHFDEQLGEHLATCLRLLGSTQNHRDHHRYKNAYLAAVDLQERLQAVPDPDVASQVLTAGGTYPLYRQWARAIAARLHRIARDLERDRDLQRDDNLDLFTETLVQALAEKMARHDEVGMVANYMANNAKHIDRVVQRVAPLNNKQLTASKDVSPLTKWRQMMNWSHPVLRGSVRMSLLLALASEIGRWLPLENGFWIISTVVVVWQSSFVAIRSRAWLRAAGTLGGIVAAMVVLNLGISGNYAIAVAVVLVPPTLFLVMQHHGWTTAGVTLILMLALEAFDMASNEILLARMLDTVIGCALMWAGYRYLWPQWQGGRQRQLRRHALQHLFNYNALIVKRFTGESISAEQFSAKRTQAYELGIALNDSLKQMRQEPGFGVNVNNSAALLALYKGAMSNMNAIVPQAHKGMRLEGDEAHELQQLFGQLNDVMIRTCNGEVLPWPEGFNQSEKWLFDRLQAHQTDRTGFVLYQFSLMLQRFHAMHQILLQPAPAGRK